MRVIDLKKEPENDDLINQDAIDDGSFKSIYPGTIIQINGETELVYGKLEGDWSDLVSRLRGLKYQSNTRLSRLKVPGKENLNKKEQLSQAERNLCLTFGFKPANHVVGNSAGACELNRTFPLAYEELIKLGSFAMKKYEKFHPKKFKEHCEEVESKIKPHWLIPGTPYTQGIVNNTSSMKYHYDRGNFKNRWSVMAYFCHAIGGGNLLIPSLKIKLEIEDHTFVLFNGNGLIHGVTKLKRLRPNNYRYSIVYYSRIAMMGLGSFEDEIDRIRTSEVNKHNKRVVDKK